MRNHFLRSWNTKVGRCFAACAAIAVLNNQAFAHTIAGQAKGFVTGFLHPLSGLDHILAMVAVGIWGSQLRRPAIWVLPVAFPLVMAFGGVLGVRGLHISGVEIGVAASALVLGVMIALNAQPPLWIAAVIVGIFAIFHGYAHGIELPKAASPLTYALGFVLATGLLHICGIVFGLINVSPSGARVLRVSGGLIALIGAWLLIGVVK
jgi:urease accessory protein